MKILKGFRKYLSKAYLLEAIKDALDLIPLLEIHNTLTDVHVKGVKQIDRSLFKPYKGTLDVACEAVRKKIVQVTR